MLPWPWVFSFSKYLKHFHRILSWASLRKTGHGPGRSLTQRWMEQVIYLTCCYSWTVLSTRCQPGYSTSHSFKLEQGHLRDSMVIETLSSPSYIVGPFWALEGPKLGQTQFWKRISLISSLLYPPNKDLKMNPDLLQRDLGGLISPDLNSKQTSLWYVYRVITIHPSLSVTVQKVITKMWVMMESA